MHRNHSTFFSPEDKISVEEKKERTSENQILPLPSSPRTRAFTPDENGKYDRLDQSIASVSVKLYKNKISKFSKNNGLAPTEKFQDGLRSAPMEEFLQFMKNGITILGSQESHQKIYDAIVSGMDQADANAHITYAIIREKETGRVVISLGGSGAHAISSMDARLGNYFIEKNYFTRDEANVFKEQREARFEVLAAGDMRMVRGNLQIDNQSGAYPDAFLSGEAAPDVVKGRENTSRALSLFGLDRYFVPYEPAIENEATPVSRRLI